MCMCMCVCVCVYVYVRACMHVCTSFDSLDPNPLWFHSFSHSLAAVTAAMLVSKTDGATSSRQGG